MNASDDRTTMYEVLLKDHRKSNITSNFPVFDTKRGFKIYQGWIPILIYKVTWPRRKSDKTLLTKTSRKKGSVNPSLGKHSSK